MGFTICIGESEWYILLWPHQQKNRRGLRGLVAD